MSLEFRGEVGVHGKGGCAGVRKVCRVVSLLYRIELCVQIDVRQVCKCKASARSEAG